MRLVFVGDIHGCLDHLNKLLLKIGIREDDQLIFLGDYTDRGPKSFETAKQIMKMKSKMGDRLVLIYGNHEDMMLNDKRSWLFECNGGKKTFEDFLNNHGSLKEYKNFIENSTAVTWESERMNAVHGGTYYEDMNGYPTEDLVWNRDAFNYRMYRGKLTVVGHTPVEQPTLSCMSRQTFTTYKYDKWYKLPKYGLLDIDTGCFFTGNLTALIVDDDKMMFMNQN